MPTERTLARACREGGATVRLNTKLRDMNVVVHADDERAIEVLAAGLPIRHGAQLAVDITLRSALTASPSKVNGAVLKKARRDKKAKYVELLHGDRCQLVVVSIVTGGRWSTEAAEFIDQMASGRAREAPPVLRGSAHLFWRRGG